MADAFRPTLLVGVGGTGCRIVSAVYAKAKEEGILDKGRMAVLGFDTDENEFRRVKDLDRQQLVRFSTPDRVYSIVRANRDDLSDWFVDDDQLTTELRNLNLIEGAAQIRMLTRLALHVALKRQDTELAIKDTIARLGRYDSRSASEGAINVTVAGSLAGATGSACFLPISLLIDGLCRQSGFEASIRGVFLLGDVFIHGGSLPIDQIPNVRANTYAALRELHAVNAAATGRGATEGFVFEYSPGRKLQADQQPFRSFTLIDFENSTGGNLGSSLGYYQGMAARAVFSQLFTPIGQQVESSTVNDARAKLAAAGQGGVNLYNGMGVGTIQYPVGEIREYLTRRFALENIAGDWLVLDQMYRDRLQRYIEARDSGDSSVKPPDRGISYVDDFMQLAKKENRAFFRQLEQRLFPVTEDEYGEEVARPQVDSLLDALVTHALDSFWDATRNLQEIRDRQLIDESMLDDEDNLVNVVRDMERLLDRDWRDVQDAVRDRPDDIFNAYLTSGDGRAPAEWGLHHLQTYFLKNGPHMVQLRFLLYSLLLDIIERRSELHHQDTRDRLFGLVTIFDQERTKEVAQRGSAKVLEAARDAIDRGVLGSVFKKKLHEFRSRYIEYFNESVPLIQEWTEARVLDRIYERLAQEVERLLKIVEDLFLEIEQFQAELTNDIGRRSVAHERGTGIFNGTIYVLADQVSKESLWRRVQEAAGGRRQDEAANQALAEAIYNRYREARKQRRESQLVQTDDIATLFRKTLIDDFARPVLEGDYRSLFDLSVLDALQQEAALKNQDWEEYLRHLVRLVADQSEPFLDLIDEKAGQRIMYWGINPSVRERYGSPQDFDELFSYNQGEAPMVLPEFTDKELICVNARVNLELTDLTKLHPGDPDEDHVNAPAPGIYFQEYNKMVEALLEADLNPTSGHSGHFTPHVHRDWHKPGRLPEIFPHRTQAIKDELDRAFVEAIALQVIDKARDYDRTVAYIDLSEMPDGSGFRKELLASQDDWEIYRAFIANSEIARAVRRYWDLEVKRNAPHNGAADFDLWPLGQRLTSPELAARLLSLSSTRRNVEDRDRTVRSLLEILFNLVEETIGIACGDLGPRGVSDLAKRKARQAGDEAVNELEKSQGEETMQVLRSLYKQAFSGFESRKGD